jgi:GH43 family beta-xylosidase
MRQPSYILIVLLVFSGSPAAFGQGTQQPPGRNPVWAHDFPDPTVIRTADGTWYAYGTQGGYAGHHARIQVASSPDGIRWSWRGDALGAAPAWASRSRRFWAPDVVYDSIRRRYVLYYAAQSDGGDRGMGIGVAVSLSPLGPFRDAGKPLVIAPGFEAIDPMAFRDPVTGKKYLYWGSDSRPLRVRELSDDWLSFKEGSSASVVLAPDVDSGYDRLIEGPWVTFHGGYYYLFYSGDNCCGAGAHYAVMVARSSHPGGPFTRYSTAHGTRTSVILHASRRWVAPGHNSVVTDEEGRYWMYYHAIPAEAFHHKQYGRVMLRRRIRFQDGWPRLADDGPDRGGATGTDTATFTNPLLPSGADPWATYRDGYYYYMQTMGKRLVLWKTRDLARLGTAERKTIWTPPANKAWSREIWAPEIHFMDGKWYVYFAADDGKNENHRIYVIENASPDPMQGTWVFKGKVADSSDKWAIDASVFPLGGRWYMVWSGWEGDRNGQQNIYLARLKNPWTIGGSRVRISYPLYPWERHGSLPEQDPSHVYVNEGPEILTHSGKVFLVYSASGCWTDFYTLGLVSLTDTTRVMDPRAWKKFPEPIFTRDADSSVFAPGHNGFFRSPDGTQDWIIYHANDRPGAGCGRERSPRMQPFGWDAAGMPVLGKPVRAGTRLTVPSGTLP